MGDMGDMGDMEREPVRPGNSMGGAPYGGSPGCRPYRIVPGA